MHVSKARIRRSGKIDRWSRSGGRGSTRTSCRRATAHSSRWRGCRTTPPADSAQRKIAARLHAVPPRSEAARPRGGTRRRRTPESASVRRSDRHGADPLGRRASRRPSGPCRHPTSSRVPRAASWHAGTCMSSARRRLRRSPHGPASRRHRGRSLRRAGRARLPAVRTPIGEGLILTRDEPALPRSRGAGGSGTAPTPAATRTSSFREPIASSWFPRRTAQRALDLARLAGRRARRRGYRWDVATSAGGADDPSAGGGSRG